MWHTDNYTDCPDLSCNPVSLVGIIFPSELVYVKVESLKIFFSSGLGLEMW